MKWCLCLSKMQRDGEELLDSDMIVATHLTHLQQGPHRQRRRCSAALLHHLVTHSLQQVSLSQGC